MRTLKSKKMVLFFSTTFLLSIGTLIQPIPANAFSDRNLSYGTVGYSVYELQNRLKYLGYYHGSINGIFDWDTYWAVRDFQYAFGMQPTGYVDMATKIQLVNATQGWHYNGPLPSTSGTAANGTANTNGNPTTPANANNSTNSNSAMTSNPANQAITTTNTASTTPPSTSTNPNTPAQTNAPAAASASNIAPGGPVNGLSQSDLNLMAHVVYAEARGEPFQAEVAVAAVILNRMKSPKFPHSISGIIYQPGAFQSVANGQINLQPDAQAMQAVLDAVNGMDPVGNALYYFNPATSTNSWIWSQPEITQIGNQIFSL